jgi:hypothetical protein
VSCPNTLDLYDAELGDVLLRSGSLGDAEATERLLETAHYSDKRGVVLDSRSWLITADDTAK